MVINFQLAKEIFGITPWFMDAKSFPVLSAILKNSNSGVSLELPEEKYNAVSFLNVTNETRTVDRPFGNWYNPGQLDTKEDFEAIAIVNINGPITKSGGASSYGMGYVSSLMLKMHADERIKGFLIYCDSGGGSSSAVQIMTDTIATIQQTKPVYSLIQKGGMACSAMYGIISGSRKIYSESPMNFVGSVGTMIQFEGRKANSTSPDGTKYIRVYASQSTDKNKDIEAALNEDNYQYILDNLLNPINENFINTVENNRPQLKGTDFSNGNDKFAKDSIGTFIDGIKSFTEVVDEVMLDYQSNYKKEKTKSKTPVTKEKIQNNTNKQIQGKMTVEELKSQHPETYNAIFKSGVTEERERTATWMAHFDTDSEAVRNGIKSGEVISASQREELLVKSMSNSRLGNLSTDSSANPTQITAASAVETEEQKEEKEIKNFYGDLLK